MAGSYELAGQGDIIMATRKDDFYAESLRRASIGGLLPPCRPSAPHANAAVATFSYALITLILVTPTPLLR